MCFLLLLLSLSFSVLSFVLMYLFVFAEVEVEKRRVTGFEIQLFTNKKKCRYYASSSFVFHKHFVVDMVTYLGINP